MVVGRPVARALDDGWTLEVTRMCTDGTRNACSLLYGAAWRATRALGYHKLMTYTLNTEPGTSLLASGWKLVGQTDPVRRGKKHPGWNSPNRARADDHPLQPKLRWEAQ